MASSRPGFAIAYDSPAAGAAGAARGGVPGSPAGSTSRLHIDADIQDYYDDFDQLPAPHRLSTAHSPSPYPDHASSPYLDPYASYNDKGRNSIESFGFIDQEYPRRSFGDMDNHFYPTNQQPHGRIAGAAAGAGAGAGYMPTSLHDHEDLHNDDGDAWGTYSASRDRYMARKEAQMASVAPAGFGAAAGIGAAGAAAAGARTSSRFSMPWSKEKAYANDAGGYSYGDEMGMGQRKSRMKWYIGGVGALALLIVIIAIGVTVAKAKGQNSSGSRSTSGNNGVTGVTKSDPSDPSKFDLDSRLKQSFYGMCYTPLDAQYPQCGDTLESVIEDVQLLSQLTTRLRLYGADCNVTQLTLEAIKQTKVNMTIFPAVWVDNNATTYARQVAEIQDAITKYGVDQIEGVTVGNEFLLNGGSELDLIQKMADMRTLLAGMALSKTVPVGTADAGSMITATLAAGADYIQANIHPWFGEVPVELGAGWTWDYAMTNTPSTVLTAPNAPKYYIAEVGWPSGANQTSFEALGPAIAGIPNVNTLLAGYVCAANANASALGTSSNPGYFWFEAFDEPWKDVLFGGVEAHWGLFDSGKKLKEGLVLPDCVHP
ncbi:unnamed protein product [Tilletia controversa]|uniref:glucan endo-1,3-beta-D-glucosidase n=1 Tax=Tilletia controversa TaxID=13291 RepID=A0A8X7MPG2_9BASI|nr:hypothetical protein CF328_g1116 [Tilletia controversa]KAE8243622.1 hypothetical protein A4X06_0g6191 [Tilletia controversa]CAD6920849.1 unnamed protein product [Tilletia controversa]CAD6949512.1 unnamed protein product [Tilletia controversa]CAD6955324.1 unnamed protein product [Tilletia controversa]